MGTAIATTGTSTTPISRIEQIRRRGMSIALASSYFAVMGAKCALPSVLNQLTSKTHGLSFVTTASSSSSLLLSPQQQMAQLLGLSTLSIAIGKLILGPMIDTIGGIFSLQIALSLLCALLLIISTSQSFHIFGICWVCIDFIFSACWPACINAIYQSFPATRNRTKQNGSGCDDDVEAQEEDDNTEWSKQIGILATGARIGNASAFTFFAMILHLLDTTNDHHHHYPLKGIVGGDGGISMIRQSWRYIFFFSALLQIIPLGLLSYFGGMTNKMMKERRSASLEEKVVDKERQPRRYDEDSAKEVTTAAATATLPPPTTSPPPAEITTSTPSIATKNGTTTKRSSSSSSLSPIQLSLSILRKEVQTLTFWLHLASRSCLMVYASFLLLLLLE